MNLSKKKKKKVFITQVASQGGQRIVAWDLISLYFDHFLMTVTTDKRKYGLKMHQIIHALKPKQWMTMIR